MSVIVHIGYHKTGTTWFQKRFYPRVTSHRYIEAQLDEAPAAPSFTFQREPPARDWASIGVGVSAVLPNGLQPFVQFATIQGNENFVTYGGTAGVRLGF